MTNPSAHALVSPGDVSLVPYPYVYINEDGSARELHSKEREYLETPFGPGDGARPYVKFRYEDRDGWGSLAGFCARSEVPSGALIAAAPAEDPHPPMSKEEHVAWLRSKMVGFDVVENPDGTVSMRRRTGGSAV
ncbi:MAG: hypothetical protein ABR915_04945 [Thermoguttaceae bacterium]